jgi:hypothetical protein
MVKLPRAYAKSIMCVALLYKQFASISLDNKTHHNDMNAIIVTTDPYELSHSFYSKISLFTLKRSLKLFN